jgi:hypothetical protein
MVEVVMRQLLRPDRLLDASDAGHLRSSAPIAAFKRRAKDCGL